MSNRNSVLASGTVTDTEFWYRYRSRNLFSRNRNCIILHFFELVHFNETKKEEREKKSRKREKSKHLKKGIQQRHILQVYVTEHYIHKDV